MRIKNSSIKKKTTLAIKHCLATSAHVGMGQLPPFVGRTYIERDKDSVWLHSKKIAKSLMNIYNEEVEDIDRFVSYIEKEKI